MRCSTDALKTYRFGAIPSRLPARFTNSLPSIFSDAIRASAISWSVPLFQFRTISPKGLNAERPMSFCPFSISPAARQGQDGWLFGGFIQGEFFAGGEF